jgi:hypothetical protein
LGRFDSGHLAHVVARSPATDTATIYDDVERSGYDYVDVVVVSILLDHCSVSGNWHEF